MARKVLGWFVLVLLFAGTICGIVFGVKYAEVGGRTAEENISYIQTLETRIDDLEEERLELLLEISELEEDNAYTQQLRGQVNDLTAEIDSLKEELAYNKQLLEAYQNSEKHIVEFYADGVLFDIMLVGSDTYVNVNLLEEPTKIDHRFDGWAIEGTTDIVDFTSLPITADTTFEAIFSPTKEVLFSGEKLVEIGSATNMYTSGPAYSLKQVCSFDSLLYSDYIVTLELSMGCSGDAGAIAGGDYILSYGAGLQNIVYTADSQVWGTISLTSVAIISFTFDTTLNQGYYLWFTITEVVGILK